MNTYIQKLWVIVTDAYFHCKPQSFPFPWQKYMIILALSAHGPGAPQEEEKGGQGGHRGPEAGKGNDRD